MKSEVIKVDCLARIEGRGGLSVTMNSARVADVKLTVSEPPRFFEALLRDANSAKRPILPPAFAACLRLPIK